VNKAVIPVIIILAVGLPTAYGITITLGGDPVIINGILDLMGNRITNVGTPTTSTDAVTKAYVDSAPSTDTLALLGCTDTQIAKFVGSAWTCTADSDTTFDGTDFAVSNQACSGGQKATGVDASGNVICAVDIDTDTLTGLGCTTDQVAKFSGSIWECVKQSAKLNPIFVVDSVGNTGFYTSIAIGSDNLPIIAYLDNTDTELEVAHCDDAICSTSTITTDTTVYPQYISSTIGSDNLLIIAYFDVNTTELKVHHCSDLTCSASTITLVDGGGFPIYTSIAIGSDNFPVISYVDDAGGDLKVAHCSNVTCTASSTTVVDNTVVVSVQTSIAIGTDGFPIVSYFDDTNDNLRVAHCGNLTCTAPVITVLDPATSVGRASSIVIGSDNLPIISYEDQSGSSLKVVHCTTADCQSFDTPTFIDASVIIGIYTSIAIGSDNLPVIGYHNEGGSSVKVAHCANITCSTTNLITLDNAGVVGDYVSMTIGPDGNPIMSYQEAAINLKVATDGVSIIFS